MDVNDGMVLAGLVCLVVAAWLVAGAVGALTLMGIALVLAGLVGAARG